MIICLRAPGNVLVLSSVTVEELFCLAASAKTGQTVVQFCPPSLCFQYLRVCVCVCVHVHVCIHSLPAPSFFAKEQV